MIGQFFRNAGVLISTEIALRIQAIIFMPLLTRYFGALNYGVWSQVGLIGGIFLPLIVMGTDSAILRFLPGRPVSDQKRLFSAWLIFLVATGIAACLLIVFFRREACLFLFGEAGEYEKFMPLVAANVFIGLLLSVFRNWFRLNNDAKTFSVTSIGQSLLGMIPAIAVLYFRERVYDLVLYGLACDFLVTLALALRTTLVYGWARPDFSIIPSLLKFGIPILPAGYAMWGLNYMDRVFLVKYGTLAEIGVYSVAYSLGYAVIQVFVNPIWLMYPNSAAQLYNQHDLAGLQQLFENTIKAILVLVTPMIIGLFVLGKPLVRLLATEEFSAAGPLISIITSGYLFLMLAAYYEVALGLAHKQYLSTVSMTIAVLVNLGLNILLIPKYTILGAAVATAIAFLVQLGFSFVVSQRYITLKTHFGFPLKVIAASVLTGTAAYACASFLPEKGLLTLLLPSLIGGITYCSILFGLRIIRTDTLRFVSRSVFNRG